MKQEGLQQLFQMGQTGAEVKIEQSFPEFSSVKPDQVEYVFALLRPEIDKALSKGQGDGTTAAHMMAKIMTGNLLMWAIVDDAEIIACVVLSVKKTDTMTKLLIELVAGKDSVLWNDALEQLVLDFKDLVGATCIEASCRLGLAKYLHKRGWRKKAVIMELT